MHKSAITDHVAQENHSIDFDHAKVIDREDNRQKRWIKEAIKIRQSKTFNRDQGNHELSHIWDSLLMQDPKPSRNTTTLSRHTVTLRGRAVARRTTQQ